jgi:hypothetical protein
MRNLKSALPPPFLFFALLLFAFVPIPILAQTAPHPLQHKNPQQEDRDGAAPSASPSASSVSPDFLGTSPAAPQPRSAQQIEDSPMKTVPRRSTNASAQSGTVRRIALIDLPGQPGFQGAILMGGNLLMAHSATNSLDVFDISRRRIIAQVKDMSGAAAVVQNVEGSLAYVANSGASEIAVVSTRDWKVERRIALDAAPRSLLLVPDLDTLYSANWNARSITTVNLKKGSARTVAIDGSPESLAFDPERKQIYATLEDVRQVAVLSSELQLKRTFVLNGAQPSGIAYDKVNSRIYVAVRNAVVILDPETGQELGRAAAPAGVDDLQIEGERLYAAANGGTVIIFKINSGINGGIGGGIHDGIQSTGLLAEREITSEVRGHILAFDPKSGMILIPGGLDGRSKLLLMKYTPGPASAPFAASR